VSLFANNIEYDSEGKKMNGFYTRSAKAKVTKQRIPTGVRATYWNLFLYIFLSEGLLRAKTWHLSRASA
jgi:hypothetical protein